MRVFRTSDGYKFYEQPDGTLTDNRDPEFADMTYANLEMLKRYNFVEEVTDEEQQ